MAKKRGYLKRTARRNVQMVLRVRIVERDIVARAAAIKMQSASDYIRQLVLLDATRVVAEFESRNLKGR
jgi:uncharacterized protein (DUF1778 family)